MRRSVTLQFEGSRHELHLPLVGEFQIENALVAAGLAIVTGTPPDDVFDAMEDLEGAKGRLEFVGRRGHGADLHRLCAQARCACRRRSRRCAPM